MVKVAVYSLILLLAPVLLLPGQVYATTSTSDFKVFVANDAVHELQLKATRSANGQVVPVSNFAISPESVVQVKQGESLTVFTSTNEPQRIEKVKVIDANGLETELLPLSTQNTQYSLNNLNVGVYTLDIIVDDSDSGGLLGYETILVKLAPGQSPIESTEIVRIVSRVSVDVDIDFDDEDKDPVICPAYGTSVNGKCVWVDCPEGYVRSGGEVGQCIPICDEDNPPNIPCYDEGDPDDCEPGFVDRGNGCEREEEPPIECPDGRIVPAGEECPEEETEEEETEEVESEQGETGEEEEVEEEVENESGEFSVN